jgi:outer membrane protein assembly factor BamB
MLLMFGCKTQDPLKGFVAMEEVSGEATAEEQIETAEAEPEPEAVEEAEVFLQGVVIFSSGYVSVRRGEQWHELDVEDLVETGDLVKTNGDSFAEIQFTDFGIIRIQQNTELIVRALHLQEGQSKVDMKLNKGKVLAKVSKLSKGEEFEVRTSTALAGVRGTEFMVKQDEGSDRASIAVKEGKVSVVPIEVADKIEKIKGELKTEAAKEVLEGMEVPEILVAEDEEVELDVKEVERVAESFAEVTEVIEQKVKAIDEKVSVIEEKREVLEREEGSGVEEQAEVKEERLREIEEITKEVEGLKEEVAKVSLEKTEEVKKSIKEPVKVSSGVTKELEEIEKIEQKEFVEDIVIASRLVEKEGEGVTAEAAGGEAGEEVVEEPLYTKLMIKTRPRDARIYIDGEETGKGRISGLYDPGVELELRVERAGYLSKSMMVKVYDQEEQEVTVVLKRDPVTWRFETGGSPFIRGITVSGHDILAANEDGKVYRVSAEGRGIWGTETGNSPNNNSMPVLVRNRVMFTGMKELTAMNFGSGVVEKRVLLGRGEFSSHMFGRRVVPFGEGILYPSNNEMILLDADTLEARKRVEIPEYSNSTPAVYGGSILIVNRRGQMLRIGPEMEGVEVSIESGALQPVSSAPTVEGDNAVFAGRGGTVVYADLDKNEVIWENKIDVSKGVGIFQDIPVGEEAVYPYTGNEFYALSREGGKEIFKPVISTSVPLYHDGKLYFGDRRNRLVVMDAVTGKVVKSWELDSRITIQPAIIDRDVVVGTESGAIYRINLKYM